MADFHRPTALNYELDPEESTGAGLRRIAEEDVARALEIFDDPNVPFPEQVHELRRTCKKMRAVLHLVGTAGGDAERNFRDAARSVSAIRDRHVQTEWLANGPVKPASLDEGERKAVRHAMAQLRDGLAAMSLPPEDTQGLECLYGGFEATLARCRNALGRVEERPVDHRFHRLRKWVKYHWYQLRLLSEVVPGLEERLAAMERISEDLGAAQDCAVMEANLSEQGDSDPEALGELARRKKILQKRSREACLRWFAEPVQLGPAAEDQPGPSR